jgi:hypothetical protein
VEIRDGDELPVRAERTREVADKRIILVLFDICGIERFALAASVEERERRDTGVAIGRNADNQPLLAGDSRFHDFKRAKRQFVRAFSAILLDRAQIDIAMQNRLVLRAERDIGEYLPQEVYPNSCLRRRAPGR